MIKKLRTYLMIPTYRYPIIALIFIIIILFVLITTRIYAAIMLRIHTNKNAIPLVNTLLTQNSTSMQHEILLPGTIRAWHEAAIYARINGYIKSWAVDIGDQVTAGQVLAEIDAPELDAELHQAEAALNVVVENNKLAQSTAVRWLRLVKSDFVSKQATDERVNAAHALQASVIAARAEYQRLQELVTFKQIRAPFDGTIAERSIDIGSLINAGHDSDTKPLFRLVQSDKLRLYVKIPENYVSRITPKMEVKIALPDHPGKHYKAKLFQTANAINPKTQTLLAEFIVNNKNHSLLPGSFAKVHFIPTAVVNSVRLPINTLIFNAQGLQVATVENNRVTLKSVNIHQDFGNEVEIISGIAAGERVIINPSDSIYNDEQVRLGTIEK